MDRLQLDNAVAFRKDQRALYFRDKDGWKPIQVMTIRVFHNFNTDTDFLVTRAGWCCT